MPPWRRLLWGWTCAHRPVHAVMHMSRAALHMGCRPGGDNFGGGHALTGLCTCACYNAYESGGHCIWGGMGDYFEGETSLTGLCAYGFFQVYGPPVVISNVWATGRPFKCIGHRSSFQMYWTPVVLGNVWATGRPFKCMGHRSSFQMYGPPVVLSNVWGTGRPLKCLGHQ